MSEYNIFELFKYVFKNFIYFILIGGRVIRKP